ncbi:MAG TPA: diguanylate cyclase [Pyrinomonadaceae bacterium]|nr:diguanylate cyclase [Pyrinomonadaceae bacterium]
MSATAPEKSAGSERGRDQGRVLLVTENSSSAMYRKVLEDAGLNVVGVSGGAAALIHLRRTRPHIVIADIRVKGISALELGRMLSQTQDAQPLIFVGQVEATPARRQSMLEAGAFDYFQIPDEMALLVARSKQLVEVQQRIDRLRAEADRDYLTGLANRRRFRTALGQEVERWRRYSMPCSLVIADIDYLKRINDANGHSAGDRVIRHVASALAEASRDNDTAARLGGEEFALLLAGADETKAVAAAERLRLVVAAEEVEGVVPVTISLGVASCPVHAKTERTLYAASDAALYRAKEEGRNRTAIAAMSN